MLAVTALAFCGTLTHGAIASAAEPADQVASPVPSPTAMAPVMSPAPAASGAATPTPAPTPSPAPPKPYVVGGFADVSLSSLSGANSLSYIPYRVFDTTNGYPMLQTLDGTLTKNGTISGKLEVNLGSDANVMASYGQPNTSSFNITQLYLAYTSGFFTITGGKFVTLAGEEYIRSPDDYNFSRSYLFGYAIPFTHTGARLTFAPNSKITAILGVNNGWDQYKGAIGAKTIEAELAFTPSGPFALTANYYGGKAPAAIVAGPQGLKTLVDLIGTYKATSALTIVANYDTASQKDALFDPVTTLATGNATWNGLAGYVNYQFDPKLSGTVRGEVFNDPQGFRTGIPQTLHEGTFTLGYAPQPALLFRFEYRLDHSSTNVFASDATDLRTSQNTAALEAIVHF
jgi:hypothetical protein